jgi:hypothetical protein
MISALIIAAGAICMAIASSDYLAKVNSHKETTPGSYIETLLVFVIGLAYFFFGLSTLVALS